MTMLVLAGRQVRTVHTSPAPLWCPLPLTNKRRAYIPSDRTNVAETIRQHAPIRVSAVARKESK